MVNLISNLNQQTKDKKAMAFKTVQSLDADVTISLGKKDKKTGKTDPNEVEGYYLGRLVTTGGKFGDSTLHFFQTAKGNVGVWGSTDLDRKLGAVTPGTMVRATRNGTKPTKNGDMKAYKVEVDADNTIEVELSDSSPANDDATGADYEASYDAEIDTDDNQDDDDTTQAAALAAAERKAKVEALLRGNKGSKTK